MPFYMLFYKMDIVREGKKAIYYSLPTSYIFVQTCFKLTKSLTGNSNMVQTIPVVNNSITL